MPRLLSDCDLRRSAETIHRVQRDDGAIPWYPAGPVDPWDHVEAAMALDVAGHARAAGRAYRWLARTQRADGSWPWRMVRGRVVDATADANFTTYVAVGVLHHLLATGDVGATVAMWPTVERAVRFALDLQAESGTIRWARDPSGRAADVALVTASSGVLLALRCASVLGDALGHRRPTWDAAADDLAGALCRGQAGFAPAGRHAMDWYWPVLGGALTGSIGRSQLIERWAEFVVEGLGVRCVRDRPWVTGAETCELAMALATCGERERAEGLWRSVQHLRDADGAYWTGYVWPDRARWPVERTTWTTAAVILAADALDPDSSTARLLATGQVASAAAT